MGRKFTGVKPASNTSIMLSFSYRGQECRERIRLAPTLANLKAVARHREAILDAIERGTFDYRVTFPDSKNALKFAEREGDVLLVELYLERWLERQKHLKASTFEGYRKTIFHHLIPALGRLFLGELKRSHVARWCSSLNVSGKTINNRLSVLRSALSDAVRDDLIETNVLREWEWKTKTTIRENDDVDPFTAKEQAAILNQLEGQERNLFQFAFWTGMRTSELIGLQWPDVHFARKTVEIRRAVTRAAITAKIEYETPKTKSSKREIQLLEPAIDALKVQKEYTFNEGKYVFQNPRTNERWNGDQRIRAVWLRALQKANVRYRRPYQTRHTFASMALTAGESPMWVARQMGHKDWTMIGRIYGKWIQNAQPEAGKKVVEMFRK